MAASSKWAPDVRNAVPSRVWRTVEDLDTRIRPDGSLRMGILPGSVPLLDKHESVRDDGADVDVQRRSTGIVR